MRTLLVAAGLVAALSPTACGRSPTSPAPAAAQGQDSAAPRPLDAGPATHVCYGAGGSAVELPRATACSSVGAGDLPPANVPLAPERVQPRSRRPAPLPF